MADRLQAITLLIADVDGVMTDGGIVLDDHGVETKRFNVRDGHGLRMWQRAGHRSALLTARRSPVVDRRARELEIDHVVQGAIRKLPAYEALLAEIGVGHENVCYIGDDVVDLPLVSRVGFGVAVADACSELIEQAHHVTRAAGGHGAVREVIELILKAQGRWDALLERYRV